MRLLRIPALLVVIFALAACEYREVDGVGTRTHEDEFVPQDDITAFDGCVRTHANQWEARGEVTNPTPDRATYVITIAFEADDLRLDERTIWVRDLAPVQTASINRGWWLSEPERVTSCRVLTIDRFRTPVAATP